MAERRMFAKTIVDSDAFLDMPLSTQALYFHLSMRADDDGFINNPKKIQRMVGASDDDLKLLVAKRFIIPFESGIVVIKHWKIHNYIRGDRYKETMYQKEKALLAEKDNKAYTLAEGCQPCLTSGIPTDNHATYQRDTQDRLGKDSLELGKDRKEKESVKETTRTIFSRLLPDYNLPEDLRSKMAEWMTYKVERKEPYKEQGLKSLLHKVESSFMTYGEQAVCDLIDECMANNWKGIIFDRLEQKSAKKPQTVKAEEHYSNPFLRMAQGVID